MTGGAGFTNLSHRVESAHSPVANQDAFLRKTSRSVASKSMARTANLAKWQPVAASTITCARMRDEPLPHKLALATFAIDQPKTRLAWVEPASIFHDECITAFDQPIYPLQWVCVAALAADDQRIVEIAGVWSFHQLSARMCST